MKRPMGYSLVEILVVISIIAALLGLLIPSLKRATDAAKLSHCASNLRQMGQAFSAYANDFEESLPPGQVMHDTNTSVYAIWGKTWPVIRSADRFRGHGVLYYRDLIDDPSLFYCPSWTHPNAQFASASANNTDNGWPEDGDLDASGTTTVESSYHYRSTFGSPRFRPAKSTRDPAFSAIMADAFADPMRGVNFHHFDGYNVLYLDGHVQLFPDKTQKVREFNGGSAYDSGAAGYQKQEQVWQDFFSKVD